MKVETKHLKSDALNAASTMGGFMAANAIVKVLPLQNAMIKSAIPLALGLGVTLLTTNNAAKSAAYGAMAHGALSLVKSTLMGSNPIGARTAGNPMIQKIMSFAIPEGLGSLTDGDYSIQYDPYQDVTNSFEAPIAIDGFNDDAFALNGFNEDAFAIGYSNDAYDEEGY